MNKLHFELYCYGDPYLKVEVDENHGYCIEQADKFELRYYENDKIKNTHLGYYDTIYGALDAANAHYAARHARQMRDFKDLDLYGDEVDKTTP
jgi:hypothetical protein